MTTLSYSFYSDGLNKYKYNLLKEKAIILKQFRNDVSEYIFDNKLNINGYLDKKLSRAMIQKETKIMKPAGISEKMFECSILDVITMYNNRKETCNKPIKTPINFNKLTFSNTNVLSKNNHDSIIGKNNEVIECTKSKVTQYKQSSIRYFINLSAIKDSRGELLSIPIKMNRKYHGDFKDFNNSTSNTSQFNTSYIVQFLPNYRLRIILTKPGLINQEYSPDIEKPIGIDVNIKHNLFQLSNGTSVNHDIKFYNSYLSFLKYLDNKKVNKSKYNNKEKFYSKRDSMKMEYYLRRLETVYNTSISNLINKLKESDYNTIVLEDLGQMPKSFIRMNTDIFEGFKVSRLTRLMRLGDIKNIFQRLGNKYNMKIVLVNPAYTSQQCPSCNHISKSNRKTQEMFSCVECGYENNADLNASYNILNRYTLYNKVNEFKNHKLIKSFFEDLSLNVSG